MKYSLILGNFDPKSKFNILIIDTLTPLKVLSDHLSVGAWR